MSAADSALKSSLGRHVPSPRDRDEVCREAYRDHGLLLISPSDDRLDIVEREIVKRVGDRLYGMGGCISERIES